MRLSDLAKKELVDLDEGNFWGPAGKADLLIEESGGSIKSMVLAGHSGFLGIGYCEEVIIPWENIVKIGSDAIIIRLKDQSSRS